MTPSRLVAVAPNPSIDRLIEVEALHHGEIHRPSATTPVAGGKGFNVARAAASLGEPVTAVGPLAGHSGRWIAERLEAEGIEVAAIWTDGETRTCTSILDRSDGSLTEIYEAGPSMDARSWRLLLEAVSRSMGPMSAGEAVMVTVSGSLPPGSPGDGLARLVRLAGVAELRIAVDGHGPTLRRALAADPWLVKVNLDEARGVLDDPGLTATAAVRGLTSAGARHAIVTLGRDGAVVSLEDGSLVHVSPPLMGVHTVGAGDAFLAGVAVGLLRGEDMLEAAISGTAAAAASTLVPAPGRLEVAEAVRLRSQIRVEPVALGD